VVAVKPFCKNENEINMKNYFVTLIIACALTVCFLIIREKSQAQENGSRLSNKTDAATSDVVSSKGSPVPVTEIPAGYRDWRFISVAHEEGNLHSFAAVLGNDVAIEAYREKKLPYPDGTIIAALHYHHIASEENNKIFGQDQSFVPGDPSNIQFMIKDSKKYASTGGWGFGHFQDGKPITDTAKINACFNCHAKIKERDLVFTRYAP
jgi:hypothetical protein